MENTYPLKVPAIRVVQPIGEYFVTVLPARILLDVAYSHVMEAQMDKEGGGYTVEGTQRLTQPARLPQITDYIDRVDAAFPNSIILAANFNPQTDLTEASEAEEDTPDATQRAALDAARAWTVEQGEDGCLSLTIPSREKFAAVIDGQHRLFAFPMANPDRLDMDLICSIFLDLPKPLQAQLFATINSTQKQVDKSLTYELFGYNISEETPELWTPDKLAVFLTRRLNTDMESPLRGRISVAPKRDEALRALNASAKWRVSTAVIVEGVLRLFSGNPKRDANEMLTPPQKDRAALECVFKDRSPLRDVYIQGNDAVLYALVLNYLKACEKLFWSRARHDSYIGKTVGIQALLDIMRRIARDAYDARDLREDYFLERLGPASNIDFSAQEFQIPAGTGRGVIRRAIEAAISLQV